MDDTGAVPRLPVLNPVTQYEKVHRIGEGTYGVVCECKPPCPLPFLVGVVFQLPQSQNPFRWARFKDSSSCRRALFQCFTLLAPLIAGIKRAAQGRSRHC